MEEHEPTEPTKLSETYEVGFAELKIILTRGRAHMLCVDENWFSEEEARDTIRALEFGLERLKKEGLIENGD